MGRFLRYLPATIIGIIMAAGVAIAGSGTLTVLDSTGITRTLDVVTDGSGNFVSKYVNCDQAAAANCQGVDASNAAKTNIGEVGGSAIALGQTTKSASVPVTIASDQTAPTPANSMSCPNTISINQTSSTDVHTFTNNIYICSVVLVSATAQSVSVVQGTGTTCATSPVGLIGGSTASMAFAANGGIVLDGSQPQIKGTATAQHLCVLQSSTGNVSGTITYADAS